MSGTEAEYLTVEQVAARLQLHPKTIRAAIDRHELRAAKFGDRAGWRILPADVDAWVASRTRQKGDQP